MLPSSSGLLQSRQDLLTDVAPSTSIIQLYDQIFRKLCHDGVLVNTLQVAALESPRSEGWSPFGMMSGRHYCCEAGHWPPWYSSFCYMHISVVTASASKYSAKGIYRGLHAVDHQPWPRDFADCKSHTIGYSLTTNKKKTRFEKRRFLGGLTHWPCSC